MPAIKTAKVPAEWANYYAGTSAITDEVCKAHLNAEYAELARQALAALCRKRPSPLASGNRQTWACAVVYALGQVNFLSDRSQSPSMTMAELVGLFGVAPSTAAAKAKVVRDALKMRPLEVKWMLPSVAGDHPMAWIVQVNGLMLDARTLPRELQVLAFEKGLIPYVPDDRADGREPDL